MDPKLLDKAQRYSTSRYLALLAGFTALYLVYGYASGVALGHTIFELDLFFLISVLFTVLVALTGRKWSATILAVITGLLLIGDPNAPVGIGLSLIPNGVVFDLILRANAGEIRSRNRFVVAGAAGNLAMAVAGLLIAYAGGAVPSGLAGTISVVVALIGNPVVGAFGALLGMLVVQRLGERVRSPLIR